MTVPFVLYMAHLTFSLIGIAVISYGVGRSFLMFVQDLFSKNKSSCMFYHARLILCENIIYGMEFMVASDVIRTIAAPDYTNILVLGGLVIIRTLLSYFLTMESDRIVAFHGAALKGAKCGNA